MFHMIRRQNLILRRFTGYFPVLVVLMMLGVDGGRSKPEAEKKPEIKPQQLMVEPEENQKKHLGAESSSPEKVKELPARKAWALGCAALLFESNHERHDILGNIPSKWGVKAWKERLSEGWGIENRKDLLSQIKVLEEHGHRESFNKQGRLVSRLSEEDYEKLVSKISSEEKRFELDIVRNYYPKLGKKSILGWDYSRIICLCRWGYHAGYITQEEAWKQIMSTAKVLQKTFDSWEDLGQNYLIGRQFWSYQHTKETGYKMEDAYQRLLDMPTSPWNLYPWDMNLEDTRTPKKPVEKKKRNIQTF
jgi:hypothetical protein